LEKAIDIPVLGKRDRDGVEEIEDGEIVVIR
jgi:hypothetical protein